MKDSVIFSTRIEKELDTKFKELVQKEGYKIQFIVAKIFKEWIDEQNKKEGNK